MPLGLKITAGSVYLQDEKNSQDQSIPIGEDNIKFHPEWKGSGYSSCESYPEPVGKYINIAWYLEIFMFKSIMLIFTKE